MDQLGDIISSLSEDDISMLKKTAASILGSQGDSDLPLLSQKSTASKPENEFSGQGIGQSELQMIMKAKQIFEKMNSQSSREADLINALKPYLSEQSREKADKAMRMIQIFQMLPLLKDLF